MYLLQRTKYSWSPTGLGNALVWASPITETSPIKSTLKGCSSKTMGVAHRLWNHWKQHPEGVQQK